MSKPKHQNAEEAVKVDEAVDEQVENDVCPQQAEEENPLAAELAECKDRLLRSMAEFDNFRKRTVREKESLFKDGVAEAVSAFLPVLDSLERAAASLKENDAATDGIALVIKQFHESLGALGVSGIDAEGQPFDPNLHNAVMHVEDESLGENTVAEVFTPGYCLKDKVIRHCVVKVAN